MADVKISGLPASTTPLAGTEVLPIVQGGQTKQVSVNNLTAGKAVNALSITATNIKTSSTTANLDISGTTVAATGSDANIDVNINAKGSGIAYLNQAWGVNQSGTLVPAANSTYDIGNGVNNPRDVGIARNIAFTGTGNRINGDFSNATYANRVLFQTTTTNSPSSIGVIPNGTGVNASLFLDSDSAATNSSRFAFQMLGGSEARITSGTLGTGTALPLTMYTGGAERLRVFTSGGVSIGNTTDPGATNLSVTGAITTTNTLTSTGMLYTGNQREVNRTSSTSTAYLNEGINVVNGVASAALTTLATVNINDSTYGGRIWFQVFASNSDANNGYATACSVREVLYTKYAGVVRILSTTEISNTSGSINAGVIAIALTTTATISGNTILIQGTPTSSGSVGSSSMELQAWVQVFSGNVENTITLA